MINRNTLSHNSKWFILHASVVLIVLAAVMLMISSDTFASSGAEAGYAQINASGGAYLRKSSSTSSNKLALLADNTSLKVYREIYKSKTSTSKTKIWYYVKANGVKGYVRADNVDNLSYTMMQGTVKSTVNYRKGPGTRMKKKGSLKKGTSVTVYLDSRPVSSTRGGSKVWYKIYQNGSYCYVCSKYISITGPVSSAAVQPTQSQINNVLNLTSGALSNLANQQFENFLKNQGFPEDYKVCLRSLHEAHPNWVFTSYKTGINWADALKRESAKGVSLVYKSYPSSYRSGNTQIEPGWYNASQTVVAYYMDPRNFLNEDRIFMFEDLAYRSDYQTIGVVNKIIGPTRLPSYGFTANIFMSAGASNNISPVFLAARVVQETGGNSVSVNGSKSGGTVVYNPFNIGAYGSNPAAKGLAYAKKMGWTTPASAVNGGAQYLASGYISKKQNSIYFQRFNVANGLGNVGTHQYMTNVMAPYSEAHITRTSYAQFGITHEALGFVIPVFGNMPARTKLP